MNDMKPLGTVDKFGHELHSAAGVDERTAYMILLQGVAALARIAVGNGLEREFVADALRLQADAIQTQDCAEDQSPIVIDMC